MLVGEHAISRDIYLAGLIIFIIAAFLAIVGVISDLKLYRRKHDENTKSDKKKFENERPSANYPEQARNLIIAPHG